MTGDMYGERSSFDQRGKHPRNYSTLEGQLALRTTNESIVLPYNNNNFKGLTRESHRSLLQANYTDLYMKGTILIFTWANHSALYIRRIILIVISGESYCSFHEGNYTVYFRGIILTCTLEELY